MKDARPNKTNSAVSVSGIDSHIGIVTYPRNGRYGLITQHIYQIVGILEGHMTVHADDLTYRVDAHQSCLLFPGQRISIRFSSAVEPQHNFVCLSKENIPESLLKDFSRQHCVVSASLHLNTLIELATELSTSTYSDRDQQVRAMSVSAFHEYHRLLTSPKDSSNHQAIERALTYIYTNYNSPINAEAIAKASGLSRQHLTKVLKEETDKTISEHLWTHRMEKARTLLTETGLQVAEIAYRTGFQTPYHMSRKLKQAYGKSPREIRSIAWQS